MSTESLIDRSIQTAETLFRKKQYDVALKLLNQVMKIEPDNIRGRQLRAMLAHRIYDPDTSLPLVISQAKARPDDWDAHVNCSLALSVIQEREAALQHALMAQMLAPLNDYVLTNLAIAYDQLERHDKALETFTRAYLIRRDPYCGTNYANYLCNDMRIDDATRVIDESIARNPHCSGAHLVKHFCLAMTDSKHAYRQSLDEYEWRLKHFGEQIDYMQRYKDSKLWNGEPLGESDTLFIYGEQGFGDFIQYRRYLDAAEISKCYRITAMHKSLQRLGGANTGASVDKFVPVEPNRFNYHIPMMSLPRFTNLGPYPSWYVPKFKQVPPNLRPKRDKGLIHIGVCWQGSPLHPNDKRRSIPFEKLESSGLFKLKGIKWYALQKDVDESVYSPHLENALADCNDFYDTRCAMEGLDFVISVDSAILHMAGTMEIKTLAMHAFRPDFRWGPRQTWYSSMAHVRQQQRDNWASVVDTVYEFCAGIDPEAAAADGNRKFIELSAYFYFRSNLKPYHTKMEFVID